MSAGLIHSLCCSLVLQCQLNVLCVSTEVSTHVNNYVASTCTTCLKMIGSSHTCHRWNESCPSELKWSVSSSRSSTLTTHVLLSMSQGLYYSYYKTIVEAPSLVSGVHLLLHDNTTEYPHTINTLKRFNLYPEVSSVLYLLV